MAICFIHTADWHLGRTFGQVPDDTNRHWLAEQRFEAVRRIGEVAQAEQASFVLVAGDLFESHEVSDQVVARGMEAVRDIGLPVLAISGNHDFARGGPQGVWQRPSFAAHRPGNFQLLLEPVAMRLAGEPVVVLPAALQHRRQTDNPCAWYSAGVGAEAGQDLFRLGLAHGNVMGAGEWGEASNYLSPDAVVAAGALDYLALGDWHGAANLQVGQQAWYSGAPEPTNFGQRGAGQVNVVRIARPGATPQVTRCPWRALAGQCSSRPTWWSKPTTWTAWWPTSTPSRRCTSCSWKSRSKASSR